MDLCLDVDNYKLNIRVAGVLIHNNKVLVHKNINDTHCCLPGGRIKIGEDSATAVKREMQEELGKKIEVQSYVATIENFFEMEQLKYHELYFLHKVEFIEEADKNIDYTMYNVEGKEYLHYEWVCLDELDNCNLLPKCLKKILKSSSFPVHIVNT